MIFNPFLLSLSLSLLSQVWSRHARHRVACFIKDASAASAIAALAPSPAEDEEESQVLYLQVKTTTILPCLTLTPVRIYMYI